MQNGVQSVARSCVIVGVVTHGMSRHMPPHPTAMSSIGSAWDSSAAASWRKAARTRSRGVLMRWRGRPAGGGVHTSDTGVSCGDVPPVLSLLAAVC
jgi:hypothetical protein